MLNKFSANSASLLSLKSALLFQIPCLTNQISQLKHLCRLCYKMLKETFLKVVKGSPLFNVKN